MSGNRRKYFHQVEKKMFEDLGDGRVKVTDANGRTGLFSWNGAYIEGELTEVNINMLVWCGGPTLPRELNYRWNEVPFDPGRPSGWPIEVEQALLRARRNDEQVR